MNYKRLYEDEYIENKIKSIVFDEVDYNEAIKKNNCFEFHYFLSSLRHDLFRWYPFKKEGTLLEIGSSYGQLTSLFTQKVSRVVAVEDSESKCEIISKRATDANVILSDFNHIDVDEKFDYIILCNIFEYVKDFYYSKNPFVDYLKYLKTLLKDDGVILIALNNRLGLKYFSGFREEHTNKFFTGIEGFPNDNYVETFSQSELINLINEAGFTNYKFFYPYPDHEFPQIINTDELINNISYTRRTKYFSKRSLLFDEGSLNQTLAKDNLSQYFANSFLIEIRNADIKYATDDINFVKLNSDRKDEFETSTVIWSDDSVSKSPLTDKANNHIKNMYENSNLTVGKIKCLSSEMKGDSIYYDFLRQSTYEDMIVNAIVNDDKEEFFRLIDDYYDALFSGSFESNDYCSEEFLSVFKKKSKKTFHCHEKSNLDLIFSNIFIIDDEFVVIDYEWIFNFPVPLEYIFFRVINHHIKTNNLIKEFVTIEEIFNRFNLNLKNIKLFEKWESNFLKSVFDHPPFPDSETTHIDDFDLFKKFDEYIDLKYKLDDSNPNKIEGLKKDIVLNQREVIHLKNVELKNKDKEIKKLKKKIKNKNKKIKSKNKEIKKLKKNIKQLINSSSWKLTKPLRKLKSIFKR